MQNAADTDSEQATRASPSRETLEGTQESLVAEEVKTDPPDKNGSPKLEDPQDPDVVVKTNGHSTAESNGQGKPEIKQTSAEEKEGSNGVIARTSKDLVSEDAILAVTANVIDKIEKSPEAPAEAATAADKQHAEEGAGNDGVSQQGGGAVTALQTDPQKSAFMAPGKVEEFMPSSSLQQQHLLQQQQTVFQQQQHSGIDGGNDMMKFNNGGAMDYNYRNGTAGHPGMQHQPQINNWGGLDDINSINYGQPPPGHMAGMMAGNAMAPQMAGMARRPMSSGGFQQQQQQAAAAVYAAARHQQPQAYPGQPLQGQYMQINRQYGAAATAWSNCGPAMGNNWSSGMPPPGMAAGMSSPGNWGRGGQRMGGQLGRNRVFGAAGSFAQGQQQHMGNQYPHHYRRRQNFPTGKVDGDDLSQVNF